MQACMQLNRSLRRWGLLTAAAVAVALPAVARASAYTWGAGDVGNWNPNNNPGGADDWTTGNDNAYPGYSGTLSTSGVNTTDSFAFGAGVTAGTINVTDSEYFYYGTVYDYSATSQLPTLNIQSGGTLTGEYNTSSSELDVSSNGTVNIAGTLSLGDEMRIGNNAAAGSATVVQTGGLAEIKNIEIGIAGEAGYAYSYSISGGTLEGASGGTGASGIGLSMGKAVNGSFSQTGGTVNANTLYLTDNSVTTGVVGSYQFSAGTLSAVTISDRGNAYASSVFDVNGSGSGTPSSISATTFSLTSTGSKLEVGLDGGGSTLIDVSGALTLGANTDLDVDALAGFDDSGDVSGHPGWYRLASYGTDSVSPNVTLTSDDGVQYSLVNDPGYLTIDVTAVPEPAAMGAVVGMALLGWRRRSSRARTA